MKKWIVIVISAVLFIILGVFLLTSFYSVKDEYFIDANSIGISNYSREDFYTEYLDLQIKNQEQQDAGESDITANGSTSAILNNSVIATSGSINAELAAFLAAKPIDFSAVSKSESKTNTLLTVYYYLHNAGFSDTLVAGVLGNVACEGNVGQFEDIPYGATKYGYYRNTWENQKYYSLIPNKSGGDQSHEYSTTYSKKSAQSVGMTYEELKTMLNIGLSDGAAVFGFGPIQATSKGFHQKYITAINELKFTGTISESTMMEVDGQVCVISAKDHFSNGLPAEGKNLTSNGNSYKAVYQKVGVTDPVLQEVASASAYWTACVEVCGGYKKLDTLAGRAAAAVKCYQAIIAAGDLNK